MPLLEVRQLRTEQDAQTLRFGREVLRIHHVEYGCSCCGRHGVAGEGREEVPALAEGLDDGARGYNRSDGIAVAHRFAEGDDIGCHSLACEAPHALSDPAETCLYFVGDE